jgi:hypothetical protein
MVWWKPREEPNMPEHNKGTMDGMSVENLVLKAKVEFLERALQDQLSFSSNTLEALKCLKEEIDEIKGKLSEISAVLSDFGKSYADVASDVDRNSNDLTFLSVFTYYLAVNVDENSVKKGDIARVTIEDAERSNVDIKFSHSNIFENLKS